MKERSAYWHRSSPSKSSPADSNWRDNLKDGIAGVIGIWNSDPVGYPKSGCVRGVADFGKRVTERHRQYLTGH